MTTQSFIHRFSSLRTRLALLFTVIALGVTGISSTILFWNTRSRLRDDFKQQALEIVSVAALLQDGGLLDTLQSPNDQNNSVYTAIKNKNLAIVTATSNIYGLYTMRQNAQGQIYFVVDSPRDPATAADLGDVYQKPGPKLVKSFATLNTPIVEDDFYTDEFGTYLSAYAPIYRADGKREGVLGLDILADTVTASENNAFLLYVLVFLGAAPITAFIGWNIGGSIATPITELTESATQMASGEFDKRVAVYGNDEVGRLGSAFNQLGRQIRTLLNSLEVRVIERTRELQQQTIELENATQSIEKRASRLQAIAQVGQVITSIQNIDELLPRITEVLSEKFQYYHVGIFLVDDVKEYALLQAANSEGGKHMLERAHRLKINPASMVGYAVETGRARIASDTGEDPTHFDNPDLPETRAEMALPLRVKNEVIGVLDVQSRETSAFKEEDIELLSIVADQVSIAIQNARQFETAQKALARAESISRQYIRQEWEALVKGENRLGYRYSRAGVGPLKAAVRSQEIDIATLTGETYSVVSPSHALIAIPIKLRGEIIGVLNIKREGQKKWEQDEIDISEAVAERVALAIENARLVEVSQAQAAREHTISDISSRISASVNLRNVLQTAAEELGRVMTGSDVTIQLGYEEQR